MVTNVEKTNIKGEIKMFICDDCLKKNYENETALSISYGNCEICKRIIVCNDIPSKYLKLKNKPEESNPLDQLKNELSKLNSTEFLNIIQTECEKRKITQLYVGDVKAIDNNVEVKIGDKITVRDKEFIIE